jgi:hypothetical protein
MGAYPSSDLYTASKITAVAECKEWNLKYMHYYEMMMEVVNRRNTPESVRAGLIAEGKVILSNIARRVAWCAEKCPPGTTKWHGCSPEQIAKGLEKDALVEYIKYEQSLALKRREHALLAWWRARRS